VLKQVCLCAFAEASLRKGSPAKVFSLKTKITMSLRLGEKDCFLVIRKELMN
jgi:hypothetical protein